MLYRILANATVIVHMGFVVFVVCGGFLAWRWRRIAWVHLPAAVWGATIEFAGWVCPLTPLENHFRHLAGQAGYTGGFVEHYLIPVLYPADWTVTLRIILGTLVVLLNVIAYAVYFRPIGSANNA
jgi:hypothetical protein